MRQLIWISDNWKCDKGPFLIKRLIYSFQMNLCLFSILPLQFKDKLALAQTGELAGSDDSTMAGSLADEPREPTKKYTGYPTPRPPSRTRKAADARTESSTMDMRVTRPSLDLQERLVQFITQEQQVNRTAPFCKYLETELDRLHEA